MTASASKVKAAASASSAVRMLGAGVHGLKAGLLLVEDLPCTVHRGFDLTYGISPGHSYANVTRDVYFARFVFGFASLSSTETVREAGLPPRADW